MLSSIPTYSINMLGTGGCVFRGPPLDLVFFFFVILCLLFQPFMDSELSLQNVSLLGNGIIRVFNNDNGANLLGRDRLPGRVSGDFKILVRAVELFGILHNAEVVSPAAGRQQLH